MKTFFQRLCSAKYGWDDLITNDYLEEWNELVKSLSAIEFISVPRLYFYYNTNDPVVTIELHGFCDASMKAYGCCVYLRFVHTSKFVKVVLVTSKSRIAPLRKQSILKLELLSCLLLVRLINTLKKEFKNFYDILNFYLWTDSSVAYSWIVNTSKVFPVFIQNRVKEIRNLVDTACFKLIDTKRNPADIISRGVKLAELLSNRLWFSGPEFLTLDKDSWPSLKVGEKSILFSKIESKGNDVVCVTSFAKRLRKINTMTYVCVTSLIKRMVTIVYVQLPLILKQTLKTNYNLIRLEVYSSCLKLQRLFISS